MMTCPDCNGVKRLMSLVNHRNQYDEGSTCTAEEIDCTTCSGTGEVDPEHAVRITRGRAMRDARLERNESIWDAAKAMGLRPSEYSDLERGRIPNRD
jgi:hypothetical protein